MGSILKDFIRIDDDYLQSYHEKLGSYGFIDTKKSRRKYTYDNTIFDTVWEVTYTIDGFKVFVIFIITKAGKEAKVNTVFFELEQYSPRGFQ